jgi:hypothetical protein
LHWTFGCCCCRCEEDTLVIVVKKNLLLLKNVLLVLRKLNFCCCCCCCCYCCCCYGKKVSLILELLCCLCCCFNYTLHLYFGENKLPKSYLWNFRAIYYKLSWLVELGSCYIIYNDRLKYRLCEWETDRLET